MAERKELGYDDTPPRNSLIFAIGAASVITLALLTPLFTGYFDHMVRAERAQKLEDARDRARPVDRNLEAQERRLASARLSVDDAMGQLARVGRRVGPQPQQTGDVQAVLGWNQLPNQAGADAAQRAGAAGAGAAPEAALDGGVPTEATAPAEGAQAPQGQGE